MNDRLHRSRSDRVIAGVAGGLAEQLRIDPALVRVVWALLVPLTGGLALLAYIVMALVVPERDARTPLADAPRAGYSSGPVVPPTDADQRSDGRGWSGSGRVAIGVILIAVGVWYLVREFVPELDLGRFWPFALILVGVLLLLFSTGWRSSGASDRDR